MVKGCFLPKIGNKKDFHSHHLYSALVYVYSRERKGIQIRQGEGKLSLFTDAIIYIENLTGSYKNVTRINEFNKVARYKINVQKHLYFYV